MSSKEQNMSNEQASQEMENGQEQHEQAQVDAADVVDVRDERIAELEAQLQEAAQRERDSVMRARAEADNIRRRAEQDVEKAHKFALEKFSNELLPVIDSLERALIWRINPIQI